MKIAILDDDPVQLETISSVAQAAGHRPTLFSRAQALISALRKDTYDLLIVDWNLPDRSGLEVVAWVRATVKPPPPMLLVTSRAEDEDIVAGLNAGAVTRDGKAVVLTAKEFALAQLLFRHLHRPLSRTYILETVWGNEPNLNSRSLDMHISRIRTKLSLRPEKGFRLTPIYSYGYRLERVSDADTALHEALEVGDTAE